MKNIFDKVIYKHIVDNATKGINQYFEGSVHLKRNEALLYCWDILPNDYSPYVTEINTNTAVDDDLVEWFDYTPILNLLKQWEYETIIVLVDGNESEKIETGKWFIELKKLCESIDKQVKIQSCHYTKTWDFKFNKRKDFILRIAWDKDCLIDKFAADKLAFKKFMVDKGIVTADYGEDIFEPNKWFVFKKKNVDKKEGVSICKIKTKKEFLNKLSNYDFVEKFIASEPEYQSGFQVEIKHYNLMFRDAFYNMTPNIYTHLWDYHEVDGERFLNRMSHSNLFLDDKIDESYEVFNQELIHPFQYKYIKINGEFNFLQSASILVYNNNRGEFRPIHMLEVGDVLLRDDKELRIKTLEVIKKQIRVKGMTTSENVIIYNGFQIQAKLENFITGIDSIITSPFSGQTVLSSEEDELVSAIMSKVKDEEMPDRVVEVTFELGGTYFTSEFLFEKPLKVINTQDYDIRMDRGDNAEPFGLDSPSPTHGWASYKPELTHKVKHMMVMKLRPGMICLTHKTKDMKTAQGLYGDMVPCKVVSMKEVVGKKSHWDIYDILPTENYFMNRMHVHNGPAKYSIVDGPDIIGHWDAGHPSSFNPPSATFYDLSTRLNADMMFANAPQSTTPVSRSGNNFPDIQNSHPNPEFRSIDSPATHTGMSFSKQPNNTYHTQHLFNSQTPLTVLVTAVQIPHGPNGTTWGPNTAFTPTSPTVKRMTSMGPGANCETAISQQAGSSTWQVYNGGGWQTWPVSQGPYIDEPAGNTAYGLINPSPKSSAITDYFGKCRHHVIRFDQSSPYVTFNINYAGATEIGAPIASTGAFQHTFNVPTPATNPRTPSQSMSFGGNNPGTPTTNHGSWTVSKIIIWETQVPLVDLATQAKNINDGQTNNGAFHEGGPQASGAGP